MGVTGADLIHEASENGEENVLFVRGLGFGEADVVVAVPDSWIDVQQMSDLADVASDFRARHGRWLRVATKYVNLTRRHFAKYGIAEYRIVESAGATEAAPASGSADLIVDITSSGSTLQRQPAPRAGRRPDHEVRSQPHRLPHRRLDPPPQGPARSPARQDGRRPPGHLDAALGRRRCRTRPEAGRASLPTTSRDATSPPPPAAVPLPRLAVVDRTAALHPAATEPRAPLCLAR